MVEGQQANQEVTMWIAVAAVAMIALAMLIIVVSRIAIGRILAEQDKLRQVELKHQRDLLENSITVQERERKRLASELHDDLSSLLNVLRLQLYGAQKNLPNAQQSLQLVDDAILVSRNISHQLYPPMLAEFGLRETIHDFIEPLRDQLHIQTFMSGKQTQEPKQDVSLQLFRIVQELISNAIKYAHCNSITIRLRLAPNYTALMVSDNGQGFDLTKAKSGLGIQNIESRVHVLNGRHKIRSAPGQGTQTIILIPST